MRFDKDYPGFYGPSPFVKKDEPCPLTIKEQRDALLEALRFYADRENWRQTKTCDCIAGGLPGSVDKTLMDVDGGDKARNAIAKAEE